MNIENDGMSVAEREVDARWFDKNVFFDTIAILFLHHHEFLQMSSSARISHQRLSPERMRKGCLYSMRWTKSSTEYVYCPY